MHTLTASLGSSVFFALAPGVVAGVVPWALTGWRSRYPSASWAPLQVVGALLLAASTAALVHAFVRFVREGAGTPAPVAPTQRLVVDGPYRYVRNPMYVAVVGAIGGQALVLGQLVLVGYAAVAGGTMAAFARWHEEPVLAARFGLDYERYRRAVPAWWPRRHPWR